MEHELFPQTLSSRTGEGEEERRMCYVSFNRFRRKKLVAKVAKLEPV